MLRYAKRLQLCECVRVYVYVCVSFLFLMATRHGCYRNTPSAWP